VTITYTKAGKPMPELNRAGIRFEQPDPSDPTGVNYTRPSGKGQTTTFLGRIEAEEDSARLVFTLTPTDTRPGKVESTVGVSSIKFKRTDEAKQKAK
jgi:hypothetical protein